MYTRSLLSSSIRAALSQVPARVESVQVLDAIGVGGMVSTAGRAKLLLRYADNAANLPDRVQVKMIVGERSGVPSYVYETPWETEPMSAVAIEGRRGPEHGK